jgi:8-oxo-dGTP pyrophosphatase MutT (NUDIX family)
MPRIKKSYGIICCRKHPDKGFQIILVKKPVTYYFCEFLAGRYHKNDDAHLIKLFNNMSYHEKVDVLSLNFANMWYRSYSADPAILNPSNTYMTKQYLKKKNKFEFCFLQDEGKRLKKLIADSINVDTAWEIPKGRKNELKEETDISAAIREFEEETHIDSKQYKILWHLKPYVESYADFGITYQNIYYYAMTDDIWEPTIRFSDKKQISEVADIRWCGISDLMHINLEKNTYNRLITMFKKVIKKCKNYYKFKLKVFR